MSAVAVGCVFGNVGSCQPLRSLVDLKEILVDMREDIVCLACNDTERILAKVELPPKYTTVI